METKQALESQDQGQQKSTLLSSNSLQIVPYVYDGQTWILHDDFVGAVYDQMIHEGLLKTVFWGGHVSSKPEFIEFCKNSHNVLSFIFDRDLNNGQCVGFSWLGPISDNYAFGHFCLFKSVYGGKYKDIGDLMLNYWFSFGTATPLFDVILGMVPGFNKKAQAFVEKIGMTRLGVIPTMCKKKTGEIDDAVIFYKLRLENGRQV